MHARKAGGKAAKPDVAGEATAAGQLIMFSERLGRTVAVARALILSGRTVDLAGIDDGIGMLCAKTLDLPRDQARQVLPALHELLAQLGSLTASMQAPRGGGT